MTPLEGMAERAAERAVSEREAERRAIERAVPRIEEYPVPCWCRWLAEKLRRSCRAETPLVTHRRPSAPQHR